MLADMGVGLLLAVCALRANAQTATVDQIVYDHCGEPFRTAGDFAAPWGKHEGYLHGMPSNWKQHEGVLPGFWSSPYQNGSNGTYYGATQPWGQCYEWAGESPVTNVRMQVRNHSFYAHATNASGQGSWTLLAAGSSNLGGGYYTESSFSGTTGPASRDESSNGGGRSWAMQPGKLVHWWTSGWPRPARPAGVVAYFSIAEIRLIPDTEPTVDLTQAKYLAAVSSDVYLTTTTSGTTPAMSITRHRFLTPQWQTFTSYITESKPTSVTEYRNQILSQSLPPGVSDSGVVSNGLNAAYYNNKDLGGIPALVRVDPTVNFTWGTGSPGAGVNADHFSSKWTGSVQPQHGETYTFHVNHNDGARLWVNGVQLINQWVDGVAEHSATITLAAGTKYPIEVHHYEGVNSATAILSWSSASQPKQVIPSDRLFTTLAGNDWSSARLGIATSNQTATLFWPTNLGAGFTLYGHPDLASSAWQVVTNAPTISGTNCSVTLPAINSHRFFQLRGSAP